MDTHRPNKPNLQSSEAQEALTCNSQSQTRIEFSRSPFTYFLIPKVNYSFAADMIIKEIGIGSKKENRKYAIRKY